MFGRKKEVTEKPAYCYVKYLGGLKRFPKEQKVKMLIYNNAIVLEEMNVIIPYTDLKNIRSIEAGKRISVERVIYYGLLAGAIARKDRILTALDYVDEAGEEQTIEIDIGDYISKVQPVIYDLMMKAREALQH